MPVAKRDVGLGGTQVSDRGEWFDIALRAEVCGLEKNMLTVVESFLGGRREEASVLGRGGKFICCMKKLHPYYLFHRSNANCNQTE